MSCDRTSLDDLSSQRKAHVSDTYWKKVNVTQDGIGQENKHQIMMIQAMWGTLYCILIGEAFSPPRMICPYLATLVLKRTYSSPIQSQF